MTERMFWQEDVKNRFESERNVDTRRRRPSILSVVPTPPLGVFLVGLDVLAGWLEIGVFAAGLRRPRVP